MTRAPSPHTSPQGEGPNLRRWGIGLGLGGILIAIAIAAQSCGGDPAQAPPDQADPAASPEAAAPTQAVPGVDPPTETEAPTQAAPVAAETRPPSRPARGEAICPQGVDRPEILVAFERSHPMNEAQRLYAEGRRDEARTLAARLLAERRDLRGLCLARFTIGGAEIILGAPNAASLAEWSERLSAMDGVAYAEPNRVASPY